MVYSLKKINRFQFILYAVNQYVQRTLKFYKLCVKHKADANIESFFKPPKAF